MRLLMDMKSGPNRLFHISSMRRSITRRTFNENQADIQGFRGPTNKLLFRTLLLKFYFRFNNDSHRFQAIDEQQSSCATQFAIYNFVFMQPFIFAHLIQDKMNHLCMRVCFPRIIPLLPALRLFAEYLHFLQLTFKKQ